VGCKDPFGHGPYTHDLNKGGLDAILAQGKLIATMSRFGFDAVRARRVPLENLHVYREAAIEFCASKPPSGTHPKNGEVEWAMAEGETLDILVTRIKDFDGSIRTP
jgi:hypothetical protein